MRTTWLDSIQSESRVEPGICRWSEALGRIWRYGLQGDASVGTPWFHEEDMGQEEVPCLSIFLSIYFTNLHKLCAPFKNKMREIYFYKEACFVRSLKFVRYLYVHVWYYATVISVYKFTMQRAILKIPGSNISRNSSCTAIYLPSLKPSK